MSKNTEKVEVLNFNQAVKIDGFYSLKKGFTKHQPCRGYLVVRNKQLKDLDAAKACTKNAYVTGKKMYQVIYTLDEDVALELKGTIYKVNGLNNIEEVKPAAKKATTKKASK